MKYDEENKLVLFADGNNGSTRTATEPLGPISVNVSVDSATTRIHRTGIRGHRGLLTTVSGSGAHKRHHHHHHHHHKRHRDNRSEKSAVAAVTADRLSPTVVAVSAATAINNNDNNNNNGSSGGGGDEHEKIKRRAADDDHRVKRVARTTPSPPPPPTLRLPPPAQPVAQLPQHIMAAASAAVSPRSHHPSAPALPPPVTQPVPLVAPSLFSLFLNAPLLQPHTQWLYSQLYPNPYLSHIRNTMIFDNESTAAAVAAAAAQKAVGDGISGVLDDGDGSAVENESLKKSPSDEGEADNGGGAGADDEVDCDGAEASPAISPKTTAKQTDVWRPY